jgi:hypothetical protein
MNTTLTLGKVAEQAETIAIERARADLAEQRLADLREMLADTREMLADMREQRDKWETVAQRLVLTNQQPQKPATSWWRWLRLGGVRPSGGGADGDSQAAAGAVSLVG